MACYPWLLVFGYYFCNSAAASVAEIGTNWFRAIIVGVYPPAIFEVYWDAAVVFFTTTSPDVAVVVAWALSLATSFALLALSVLLGVFVTLRLDRLPTSENWGAIIFRMRF